MDETNKQQSFLGTGWDFPPTFGRDTYDVKMISDAQDIQSSLEILLSTRIGERIMQPTYGCELTKLLFEPLDTTLKAYLKDLINDAILYHEPRIILNDLKLEIANPNEGIIEITLDYTIASTNTRYNYVYPFYLSEGTNLAK